VALNFALEINKLIESLHIHRGYKKKSTVYHSGEEPQGIYFIKSGLVGLVFNSENGGEHLLRLFRPGQFFGHRSLFAEEKYHASAICLENCEIAFIEKKSLLQEMGKNPTLALTFLKGLSIELRNCEIHRVTITEKEVIQRAAEAIVYLMELAPEHKWTRQEIAEYCESTPTTIIKTLAKLEEMNLIEQDGHRIRILNRSGLLELKI
jgi:CRP-like cAMP-binding protein